MNTDNRSGFVAQSHTFLANYLFCLVFFITFANRIIRICVWCVSWRNDNNNKKPIFLYDKYIHFSNHCSFLYR